MPEIHPLIEAADRYSITVSIRIFEPLGIRKVRLIDNVGIDLDAREYDCDTTVFYESPLINRGRCPFTLEITQCETGNAFLSPPYFSPDITADHPMPCSALMCEDNHACISRQNDLRRQRNLLIEMCDRIRQYRDKKNEFFAKMMFFYTLAFVLGVIALCLAFIPYVGPYLAALFAVDAAVALAGAIAANFHWNNYRRLLDIQLREREEAVIRFHDIVDEVLANCCSGCIEVDLELPSC